MRRLLLLGATGAVGAGCLEVLARCDDIALTVAGRDEARLRAAAVRTGVEVARLDITDTAAVTAAATGCDVLVNCAGPAARLSATVAGAAIAAGVAYVDPGGDHALREKLAAAGSGVPVVLQSGVQPGLSELLLRVLARHRPEPIESVTAWCGGLQPLTRASALEYLAGLHDTHTHPGAALRGGAIHRVTREECEPAPARFFPDSVTVHPHLDAETVAAAKHLGIGTLWWLNVFDGVHTVRAMQRLALRNDTGLDGVLAAAKLDLFGRRPYFAIVCSARDSAGSVTVAFSCPDSYRVTGALAGFAARHVAEMPAGVRMFWSIDQPQRVLGFLAGAVPEVRVSFLDTPSAGSPMAEEGTEEGSV